MRRNLLVACIASIGLLPSACSPRSQAEIEIARATGSSIDVILLSPTGALRHGKDTAALEFRSAQGSSLVDVADVRARATMPMTGMPMFGTMDVSRTDTAGRYQANTDLSMAGTWRLTVEWTYRNEPGSVTFAQNVQ